MERIEITAREASPSPDDVDRTAPDLTPLLDAEILTVEDVSALLRCSSDTVRRIPRDRLPVYRPGKRNLYLRDDLIRFIRSCRVESIDIDAMVSEITRDVIGSCPDGVRGRSRRRTS